MTQRFSLLAQEGAARVGTLALPSGTVATPAFMPVGTQAAVKALDPSDVRCTGAEIILANTYHLMLRPGSDVIEKLGGVSKFMQWKGPVLTDSGGFQVFSLAGQRSLDDAGVTFRSHIDGSSHRLTPEIAVEIQRRLGADITMALDVCTGYDEPEASHKRALELTENWLPRNIAAFDERVDRDIEIRPLIFGICQGGFDTNRRRRSAGVLSASRVDGLAIGGLSVGEPKQVLEEMLAASIEPLDSTRPRYLMGVGSPEDLWMAVGMGVDMFDCVLPTRVARHGGLFTPDGRINIRAARYREDQEPIDGGCDCYCCQNFSAAYVHHLFRSGELLAYRLASIHNLRFIGRMMETMRDAIQSGCFRALRRRFLERYSPVDQRARLEQQQRYRAAVQED
jgi:queuine tRNA-ribosyltransferase